MIAIIFRAAGYVLIIINACLLLTLILQQTVLKHSQLSVQLDQIEVDLESVRGLRPLQFHGSPREMETRVEQMENYLAVEHGVNNCRVAQRFGLPSGVTTIAVSAGSIRRVYCDQDTWGGGWTVVLHREGQSNFAQKVREHYTEGFGDPTNKEFTIGLKAMQALTVNPNHVYVNVTINGKTGFLAYWHFRVGGLPKYEAAIKDEVANSTLANITGLKIICGELYTGGFCTAVLNPTQQNSDKREDQLEKIMFQLLLGEWSGLYSAFTRLTVMIRPQF